MHVCVHMCVHSCTCTLCKDSVRNKNPKSQQVVQAQSVCVYVCVHMHVCVHMCVHSCTCTLCKDSVRNKNPKSLQRYKPSLCVCMCMCVCTCVCVLCVCVFICDEYGVRAIYITMCKCVLAHVHAL